MPNIVIIGDDKNFTRKKIAKVVAKLGVSETDGVITYGRIGLNCVDMTGKSAPYLIVRDTNKGRCMKIATALNKQLNVDVEVENLVAFLPKKK